MWHARDFLCWRDPMNTVPFTKKSLCLLGLWIPGKGASPFSGQVCPQPPGSLFQSAQHEKAGANYTTVRACLPLMIS